MSEWFFKRLNLFAGWIAIAVLFGLVVLLANIEIKDLDLWLHLATGKYIVQTQLIPQVDILSSTVDGQSWINHEWLFQVIVHSVHQLGGFDGLIVFQTFMVVVTFGLLLFLGYNRQRQSGMIFVLLLVLLVYQLRFTLRPDLFSLLFFSLYVYFLSEVHRRSSLWALFFIQTLWVNIHGFFILGPAIVLMSLFGEYIKRRVKLPFEWNKVGRLSESHYERLKEIFVVVVLACLINPHLIYGAWYPFYVLSTLAGKSQIFFAHISELAPPFTWQTFFSLKHYLALKLLMIVSALSFAANYKKIDAGVFLFWLFFLFFALSAVRNIVFFAFAAYFVFILNTFQVALPETVPGWMKKPKWKSMFSITVKIMLVAWMLNHIAQVSLRGYYDFDKHERKSEFGGVSLRNFPHKAADFLVKNKIRGNFFNDFNSGSYLIGRAFPNIKVFIDGRTELYGPELFQKYQKAWKGDQELFEAMAQEYNWSGAFLNSVYVPAPAKLIKHLYQSDDWKLVYFDYDASIFLRNVPRNQNWIRRYEIDLAQWKTPPAELLRIGLRRVTPYRHVNRAKALLNLDFSEKALEEAREGLKIQPYNSELYRVKGQVHLKNGNFLKAFEDLRKAKLLDPQNLRVRYFLAEAFYGLEKLEEAKKQCEIVLKRSAKHDKASALLKHINDVQRELRLKTKNQNYVR